MNKKTKICLNAMVANEAPTIIRMLDSCYRYIDYWVIQDNGSTDGTQDIIRNYFAEKNIPGFLYETEWLYPGYNRDHTLQTCLKAEHGCDWILRMDADERLQVDDDFDWSILEDTSVESWQITAQNGGTRYFRTWLWNARLPWFFQHDKRHETIHLPEVGESFQRIDLPYSFRHLVSQDGQTWFAERKFLRDALELEIDKIVGNTVLQDYYHLWFLAKSYADCYGNPAELPFGKKHSDEYARRSIWYFERFLNLTHGWDENKTAKNIDEMSYFAVILIAQALDFIGDTNGAENHYRLADSFCPRRNEHLYFLALLLEKLGKNEELLKVLDYMMQTERTNPFPTYGFLIEDFAYYNTSNSLTEMKERTLRKLQEPVMMLDSIKFEF